MPAKPDAAPPPPPSLARELAALDRMTTRELRDKFAQVFGEPTAAGNRAWLVRRVGWRLQALAEGDLSARAKARAAELARDADLRLTPPADRPEPIPQPAAPEATAPPALDPRLPRSGPSSPGSTRAGWSR
jgi:hypothetical protein